MGDLTPAPPAFIDRGDGPRLACRVRAGTGPAILFLPGYASAMTGEKAGALDEWAARTGRAMIRFDYSGCGESEGVFTDQTLTRWRDDALAVIDAHPGDLVLVGSSMGGWLMLLAALARPARIRALVGIAAAPDFTDWGFDADRRETLARDSRIEAPSLYCDVPSVTTHRFWASGQDHLLLDTAIAFDGPVRLLHGGDDGDVPWTVAVRLADALRSADVQTLLVKDGDHRLSRPQDIALLVRTVADLMEHL